MKTSLSEANFIKRGDNLGVNLHTKGHIVVRFAYIIKLSTMTHPMPTQFVPYIIYVLISTTHVIAIFPCLTPIQIY